MTRLSRVRFFPSFMGTSFHSGRTRESTTGSWGRSSAPGIRRCLHPKDSGDEEGGEGKRRDVGFEGLGARGTRGTESHWNWGASGVGIGTFFVFFDALPPGSWTQTDTLTRRGLPVLGLRPKRSALFRKSKAPNPVSLTTLSSRKVPVISRAMKSKALRTVFRGGQVPLRFFLCVFRP